MAKNGNDIIISLNGTAIAAVRSSSVKSNCGLEEIASPETGTWRKYKAGRKEWSFSVNYLLLSEAGLKDLLSNGTTYTIAIYERGSSHKLTGSAIMTECEQRYTRGNLVQGTFSFKGTNALTANW